MWHRAWTCVKTMHILLQSCREDSLLEGRSVYVTAGRIRSGLRARMSRRLGVMRNRDMSPVRNHAGRFLPTSRAGAHKC